MIGALVELGRRYRYEHMPERASYVLGLGDGAADAADDGPHTQGTRVGTFADQLSYAALHCGRATRAYTVGYVRGYRDEAGIGGKA